MVEKKKWRMRMSCDRESPGKAILKMAGAVKWEF